MLDEWGDRRVITGWALIAACVIAIVIAIAVGATLADREDTVRTRIDDAALVECAKTPKTAVECRVLIYGAR